jgi:hypothetical protein
MNDLITEEAREQAECYFCHEDCSKCPHHVHDWEVYYGHVLELGPDYCELGKRKEDG